MIDWSPLLISLKTASLTMIFVFFLGLLAARWVVIKQSASSLSGLHLPWCIHTMGYFLLYFQWRLAPSDSFSDIQEFENSLSFSFHEPGSLLVILFH